MTPEKFTQEADYQRLLEITATQRSFVAALLKRLGGHVSLTPEELDASGSIQVGFDEETSGVTLTLNKAIEVVKA